MSKSAKRFKSGEQITNFFWDYPFGDHPWFSFWESGPIIISPIDKDLAYLSGRLFLVPTRPQKGMGRMNSGKDLGKEFAEQEKTG